MRVVKAFVYKLTVNKFTHRRGHAASLGHGFSILGVVARLHLLESFQQVALRGGACVFMEFGDRVARQRAEHQHTRSRFQRGA